MRLQVDDVVHVRQGAPDRRYRAAVEDDIARLGLADRVVLVAEAVSNSTLAGYCRTANAYLSLSESETVKSRLSWRGADHLVSLRDGLWRASTRT